MKKKKLPSSIPGDGHKTPIARTEKQHLSEGDGATRIPCRRGSSPDTGEGRTGVALISLSDYLGYLTTEGFGPDQIHWIRKNMILHIPLYALALWQGFPEWEITDRALKRAGFGVTWSEDKSKNINEIFITKKGVPIAVY